MCKAKPRPRCSQHAEHRLTKLRSQFQTQQEKVEQYRADGDPRLEAAESQLEEMRRDLLIAQADFNATLEGLISRGQRLVTMVTTNPDDPSIPVESLAMLEGHIQFNERQRQAKMMPKIEKGAHKETRQANRKLADARDRIASATTRMAMNNGDLTAWQQWRETHSTASAEALDAHAHILAVDEHGPGTWSGLSDNEREAFRDKARATADFTTPDAPVPLEETAATIIDQRNQEVPDFEVMAGVVDPVDPTIDTPTWRDDRRNRAGKEQDGEAEDGDARGEQRSRPRGNPTRDTQNRQIQRQRSARARRARSSSAITASQLRTGVRRMRLGDVMNGRGSTDPKNRVDQETAMSADGTGLLVLIELLAPKPSANR